MRMYTQRTLIFAILVGGLDFPALAQRNEPLSGQAGEIWRTKKYSPIQNPDVLKMSGAERGRVMLDGYARCLVSANPRKVEAVLSLPVDGSESLPALDRLMISDCLGDGTLTVNRVSARGALYRALYRYNFAKSAPPLQPESNVNSAAPDSEKFNYNPLRRFAECIVRDNSVAARELVVAPTVSGAEQIAFIKLSPSFANCMAKGSEVKFSKTVLVGIIAEMLYRLSSPVLVAGSK
jgi:hypothetical protein